MTLTEFIEHLTHYVDRHGDDKVCIAVTGCLSSHATVEVNGVGPGIDWSKGRILLHPDEPLERWYSESQKREQKDSAEQLLADLKARRAANLKESEGGEA